MELKLKYVGAFRPEDDELQNYVSEIWFKDSLIHVYDTENTHIDYEFVFIEQLHVQSAPYGAGVWHVLVGNFSSIYDTLEEAEASLKKQISGRG